MSKPLSIAERKYNEANKKILQTLKFHGISPDAPLYREYGELRDWAYKLGKLDGKKELFNLVNFEMKQDLKNTEV